jgi:hypothetical protein
MSWTDVFPVFTDDQLSTYHSSVSPEEAALLRDWCEVAETFNPRPARHIVSASLFWKNCGKDEPELPPITRETLVNARDLGLVSRFAPWEHYVQPLIDGARMLQVSRPDIVVRVYLAADLDFLIPDLVEAGCEVKLMRSSSIRHNPGALWRFLALEEEGCWVTVTDSDRARIVLHDIERTEKIMKSGLGIWRVPYVFGSIQSDDRPGFYRPIIACQFGCMGGPPVEMLMKAFLWHTLRGIMPDQCTLRKGRSGRKLLPIFGTEWPTYGFDEWFLLAVLYPRLAFTGVLTFFPLKDAAANRWLILDIEYVTWANPNSEVLYFGDSDLLKNQKPGNKKIARSSVLKKLLDKPGPAVS